jgi:hypothetical protein
MKNSIIISMAAVCVSIGCKPRDYNSEQLSYAKSGSNSRFTIGPVYGEAGSSGWCYFNQDENYKTQTTEQSDQATLKRWALWLEKTAEGDYRHAEYAVKITLRRYTKAHPYAFDFKKSQDSLRNDWASSSVDQINLASALSSRLSLYETRAALLAMTGSLCSLESLTAAGQIDQVAQSLNPKTNNAARLKATCDGQPVGVEKEFVRADVLNSSEYQWLRKKIEGLRDYNPNLSCPSEYYEFEVSKGKFLRWAD